MGVKSDWAEAKEAGHELKHWARTKDWKTTIRSSFQLKYLWRWIALVLVIAGAILLSHYHNTIVSAFKPHQEAIVNLPASWLIPIGILIAISFPPLFGHELVLLIVGLIWGLWVGFGIAAAGTFIGELLCYWAFKYWFTDRARKIEDGNIWYACLARLMRDGGVGIIILVRFSVLPGHIVTAIQSTVGMPVYIYCIAVLVSMPKQLVVVYLGTLFGISTATGASASEVRKERIISLSVFFVTLLMTFVAGYVVYIRARRVYPIILEEKKRAELGGEPTASSEPYLSGASQPFGSTSTANIPLRESAHSSNYVYDDPFNASEVDLESQGAWHPHSQTMTGAPTFSPVPTSEREHEIFASQQELPPDDEDRKWQARPSDDEDRKWPSN